MQNAADPIDLVRRAIVRVKKATSFFECDPLEQFHVCIIKSVSSPPLTALQIFFEIQAGLHLGPKEKRIQNLKKCIEFIMTIELNDVCPSVSKTLCV